MVDLTTGLVLRCLLNEPSGTACVDLTGRHANGTYAGSFSTVAAPYGADVARVFTSGDASFADAADLEAVANLTVMFWAKTASVATGWICTKSDAAFTTGFEFGMVGGAGSAVLRPAGLNFQPGTPDFNDDAWHHVAIAIEDLGSGNVRGKYWLDGVATTPGGSIATTPGSNSDVLRIGSRRGTANFGGALYDLWLFSNRLLTDAEVAYAATLRGSSGGGAGLPSNSLRLGVGL